jgi:Tol biopolymer transport system component
MVQRWRGKRQRQLRHRLGRGAGIYGLTTVRMTGAAATRGVDRISVTVVLAIACLGVLVLAAPSRAAFPVARNGRIAYSHEVGERPHLLADIFLVDSNGSNPVNVTRAGENVAYLDPQFSPDGRSIAASRCTGDLFAPATDSPSGGTYNCDIVLMKPDGSGLTDMTPTPTPTEEFDPSFSPSGKPIVFDRHVEPFHSAHPAAPGFEHDIFKVSTDGTELGQLTTAPGHGSEPEFSPGGRRIYYVGAGGIWKMKSNGSAQTQIGSDIFLSGPPAASPDGRKLAFTGCLPGQDYNCKVIIRDLKTGQEAILDPTALNEWQPSFSPDGKMLAFAIDTDPSVNVFDPSVATMNVDSTGLSMLTTPGTDEADSTPSWEYIYTCGGRRATIVGSDSGEKLKGTKRADVIVANGGNDVVNGRGGNDWICGGAGRDTLKGGPGKDKLKGGAGKDKQVQ